MIFFQNYLVDRKTNYCWNNFSSLSFSVDIGVGQESALSPVLSALYLSPILHIFEKQIKILKIPVFILSFVDNELFVAQNKSLTVSNSNIFCCYHIMTSLLKKFGLVIEHSKTEVFYFSRSHGTFNPPPLDFTILGGPILWSRNIWQYLGFIYDRKLTFWQHIDFYANKAILTIKCMKMLGNLTRGLILTQKKLLYRYYILPIALYSNMILQQGFTFIPT